MNYIIQLNDDRWLCEIDHRDKPRYFFLGYEKTDNISRAERLEKNQAETIVKQLKRMNQLDYKIVEIQ